MEDAVLSCQRELHCHAEVLCDGGITAAGEEWLRTLAVVEETQGDHSAHGIIYLSTCFNSHIAAGCFAEVCLQVTFDGALVTDAEVEAQVQVMGNLLLGAASATLCGGVAIFAIVSLRVRSLVPRIGVLCHLLAGLLATEEAEHVEVVDLVAPADDEVFGACLGELGAGHAQVEHTCCLVLQLESHVVVEGGVETDEGREAFVDADGADVVQAVG